MVKRRFGISIPEAMASDLDRLASRLGIDRSKLVERAIKAFLDDYTHLMVPHTCSGILILSCDDVDEKIVSRVIEEYRDIASARLHTHVEARCIETLVVYGDSSRIAEIHSALEKAGCNVRYVPLPS
ncbi:MAG: CopG family ribbon-helix-helix protein [Desulfurococcales archaeon]|nr:CopG family ribbon-helix-helix protein [Desulfurococcales archaeon]